MYSEDSKKVHQVLKTMNILDKKLLIQVINLSYPDVKIVDKVAMMKRNDPFFI